MLLTRSPLSSHPCCHEINSARLACVKHAASVRPEPGSNSPSKPRRATTRLARMAKNTLRTQQNKAVVRPECKNRTSTPRPKPKHQRPHSLLNILCSVFKERTTGSPSGDVRAAGRPPVVCAAWHTSPGRWRCRAAGLEHLPELALLAPNCSGLPTADGQDTDPRPGCQQRGASRRAREPGSTRLPLLRPLAPRRAA